MPDSVSAPCSARKNASKCHATSLKADGDDVPRTPGRMRRGALAGEQGCGETTAACAHHEGQRLSLAAGRSVRFLLRSTAREPRASGRASGGRAIFGFVLSPSSAFTSILRKRDRDLQAAFWFGFLTGESEIKFSCINRAIAPLWMSRGGSTAALSGAQTSGFQFACGSVNL